MQNKPRFVTDFFLILNNKFFVCILHLKYTISCTTQGFFKAFTR